MASAAHTDHLYPAEVQVFSRVFHLNKKMCAFIIMSTDDDTDDASSANPDLLATCLHARTSGHRTQLAEVGLLLASASSSVEESDPRDEHGELVELQLLVHLRERHEGSQLGGREDALQGGWAERGRGGQRSAIQPVGLSKTQSPRLKCKCDAASLHCDCSSSVSVTPVASCTAPASVGEPMLDRSRMYEIIFSLRASSSSRVFARLSVISLLTGLSLDSTTRRMFSRHSPAHTHEMTAADMCLHTEFWERLKTRKIKYLK